MTDEQMGPPTADARDPRDAGAAPGATGAAGDADAPSPGDPNYDAFLREVQRLADERQAAQDADRPSWDPRTVLKLIVLVLIWAIGLTLVLSAAWLRIFATAATTAADAVMIAAAAGAGGACLVIATLGILRTVHRRSE